MEWFFLFQKPFNWNLWYACSINDLEVKMMRINILQHTPNEGPGAIRDWAKHHGYSIYTYHPYQFQTLPKPEETDFLVILGGPMSPNDTFPWIQAERTLIDALIQRNIPILGICYGAQQIVKTLGYQVSKGPKEVGWAPIYLQTNLIKNLPKQLLALHWHEETFEIPTGAQLLFSSERLKNQGFILGHRIIGLQFHLEPLADNVREMVVNDGPYAQDSLLGQTPAEILKTPVPTENQAVLDRLLDYLTAEKGCDL